MSVIATAWLVVLFSILAFVVGLFVGDHFRDKSYKEWLVKIGVGKWFSDNDGKPYFAVPKQSIPKKAKK